MEGTVKYRHRMLLSILVGATLLVSCSASVLAQSCAVTTSDCSADAVNQKDCIVHICKVGGKWQVQPKCVVIEDTVKITWQRDDSTAGHVKRFHVKFSSAFQGGKRLRRGKYDYPRQFCQVCSVPIYRL